MTQTIARLALVVRDYDDALAFYVGKLGFELVEDTDQPEQDKRWVVVRPRGHGGTSLLLARASSARFRSEMSRATAMNRPSSAFRNSLTTRSTPCALPRA